MGVNDQLTNLMLVEEVKKRPILYNFHLPGYSKKLETEWAWNEIGEIVKLTASECKERWKNIRAVFVRHMKPPKNGSVSKEKKAYYLSDAMQFTVPYIKALKPFGDLSQSFKEEEEELAIKDERDESSIFEVDCLLSETPSPSQSPLPPPRPPTSSSSSIATYPQPQHQDLQSEPTKHHIPKNKRGAKNDNEDHAFIEYWKRKKVTSSTEDIQLTTDPREEPIKMFLLSMLPDLLQMDDREVRHFKMKTLNIVDEILSAKTTCPFRVDGLGACNHQIISPCSKPCDSKPCDR